MVGRQIANIAKHEINKMADVFPEILHFLEISGFTRTSKKFRKESGCESLPELPLSLATAIEGAKRRQKKKLGKYSLKLAETKDKQIKDGSKEDKKIHQKKEEKKKNEKKKEDKKEDKKETYEDQQLKKEVEDVVANLGITDIDHQMKRKVRINDIQPDERAVKKLRRNTNDKHVESGELSNL